MLWVPHSSRFWLQWARIPRDLRVLTVILVVKMPEIYVIHHPDGYDRKRKDLSTGFQVAGDYFIRE